MTISLEKYREFTGGDIPTFIYKIKHRETGLYSRGGSYPSWNKTGKVWKRVGDLKGHLCMFIKDSPWNRTYENNIPHEWDVIELNVMTGEIKTSPARTFYATTKYTDEPKFLTNGEIIKATKQDLDEAFEFNAKYRIIDATRLNDEYKVTVTFTVHHVPEDNYIGLKTY